MSQASVASDEPDHNDEDDQDIPPAVSTLDTAEAMAEVAVMDGHGHTTHARGNTVQDVAMMGGGGGDAPPPEVTDESGLLVQQRLVQFFTTL